MKAKNDATTITVGSQAAVSAPRNSGPTISVAGQPFDASQNTSVDLVFVIDSTGSMSDKIDALLSMCEQFVEDFSSKKIPFRIAIVGFGDLTYNDKTSVTPFVSDVPTIKRLLRKLPRTTGGGNNGESSLEALRVAHNLPFKAGCVRAIVLMTDEPALQHNLSAEAVISELAAANCLVFVLSIYADYFVRLAEVTGGSWSDISQASSLGDVMSVLQKLAHSVRTTVDQVIRLSKGDVKQYRLQGNK